MSGFFLGFKKGIKNFGELPAEIINVILLTFVYFFGVGITNVIARLVKKNFLETKISNQDSYWTELNLEKTEIGGYYRQF